LLQQLEFQFGREPVNRVGTPAALHCDYSAMAFPSKPVWTGLNAFLGHIRSHRYATRDCWGCVTSAILSERASDRGSETPCDIWATGNGNMTIQFIPRSALKERRSEVDENGKSLVNRRFQHCSVDPSQRASWDDARKSLAFALQKPFPTNDSASYERGHHSNPTDGVIDKLWRCC